MRIARDGTWFYMGTPIGRPELVRLFLHDFAQGRRRLCAWYTPVEKVGITVDDAPFVAVDFEVDRRWKKHKSLTFTTNVGDKAQAGPDALLFVIERDPETGEPSPYVRIRADLDALD